MSAWESYSKDATKSTGGDFVVPPEDIYTCVVKDVSEPTVEQNRFKKSEKDPDEVTRFYVEWEIEDDLDDGQGGSTAGVTFRQYMSLPQAYLEFGELNGKSTVFEVMAALGYNMDSDSFRVNPPDWIGRSARITTTNYKTPEGYERMKVKSLASVRKARERSEPTEERQPVAAGSGRSSVRDRLRAD